MPETEKTKISEIEKLRGYVTKGRLELETEKDQLDLIVEKETEKFFARYPSEQHSNKLVDGFRKGLTKLYKKSITKKQNFFNDIEKKIDRIEAEYIKECC